MSAASMLMLSTLTVIARGTRSGHTVRSTVVAEPKYHPLLDEAARVLSRWSAPDRHQRLLRSAFIHHVAGHPDSVFRSCGDGHITASAIVLDSTRRQVLLTLHPRLGRWVQMGGHIELGDPTVEAAALREATEESGIHGLALDPDPVDLDIHAFDCPKGRPNRHLDVRFRVLAPAGAVERRSHESLAVGWFDVGALPAGLDASTLRLIARAVAR
jgi:8-oxo-dGTP pyrophosphatase MutT (NUDIX family)